MDTLSDRRRFVGLFSRSPASCAKARACGPGLRLDGSEPDTVLGSAGSRAVSPVWTRRRRRFFRGSTIAINALATKDAHFRAFGASSSVLAKLGGMDTVLIATATPGLLFYLVTKKEIKNAGDLKGKRIGASRPGTDSDLAARVAVQKLGLSEKDVSLISMGTDTERLSAMTQGVAECHGGDHWWLRRGAKTGLSLFAGFIPSQRSL